MNEPSLNMKTQQRRARWSKILLGGLAVGLLLGTQVRSAQAGQRIVLLRLQEQGGTGGIVIEVNPATRVAFNSLDDYLRSRLRDKELLEVKIEQCTDGGKAIILIRYEE